MELLKQFIDLHREHIKITEQMNVLTKMILEQISPYKHGQNVESKSPFHMTKRVVIQEVDIVISGREMKMLVKANKLRHDGTLGMGLVSWSNADDPVLDAALRKALSGIIIASHEWIDMTETYPDELSENLVTSNMVYVRNETEVSLGRFNLIHKKWQDITINNATHWSYIKRELDGKD